MRFVSASDFETAKGGAAAVRRLLAHLDEAAQTAQLNDAIETAEARFLGIVTTKYRDDELPLDPTSTTKEIKSLVIDYAHLALHEAVGSLVPESVNAAGSRALKHLGEIARGNARLNLAVAASDNVMPSIGSISFDETRPRGASDPTARMTL